MDEEKKSAENTEEAKDSVSEKPTKAEKKEIAKLTEENNKLNEELQKAKQSLTEQNDKYLRMIAEYDNYRKRSGKEKDAAYADAYSDALSSILPVIDNLERALTYANVTSDDALTAGVKMTLKQFEDALTRLGVEAFGARGDDFDPHLHNAIMQVEDAEIDNGKITEVLVKGYRKGERVIRDAMVKVSG